MILFEICQSAAQNAAAPDRRPSPPLQVAQIFDTVRRRLRWRKDGGTSRVRPSNDFRCVKWFNIWGWVKRISHFISKDVEVLATLCHFQLSNFGIPKILTPTDLSTGTTEAKGVFSTWFLLGSSQNLRPSST